MLRLAIDTGGTFTDCVLHDEAAGRMWTGKTLSTPAAPERAVHEGIEQLVAERPFRLADLATIYIATTVATNAILERKGARVALVTTRGFRDVLILGRAKRYDTYDLHLDKPVPLVPRRRILEVDERIGADGAVVTPLEPAGVDGLLAALERLEVEAVAVSLLHAYANPAHEAAIGERLAAWRPDLPVSLSSAVSPKFREYERTSTTVANAYVTPVARRFLERLEAAFTGAGFHGELWVMQSSGGLMSPRLARALPVNIIESGPAAGVRLVGEVARAKQLASVLGFDMGGTTAKVGAVEDGEARVSSTFEVDGINLRPWSGLPLNVPAVELIEIGAGGGSIASLALGLIRVGPESAGAQPGPVCYGRGGERSTLTDANLVLGYLAPTRFARGRIALDADAAASAVERQIARPLGISVLRAAWGVHAVANASMERALRSMSIERGRDPRDYTLVAFGGAGPLHACRLARALGIARVLVPWGAGVGSAIGMLSSEPRYSVSMTRVLSLDAACDIAIAEIFDRLAAQVGGALGATHGIVWRRHAHLRYVGQGYEIRVAGAEGPIERGYGASLVERFHAAYRDAYGYAQPHEPVEATDWTLTAAAPRAGPPGAALGVAPATESVSPGRGRAYFPEAGELAECLVHRRIGIAAGERIAGPAIVADPESTVLIPPGDEATLDEHGHLAVDIAAPGQR